MFVGTGDNNNPGGGKQEKGSVGALYFSPDSGKTWQTCDKVTGRFYRVAADHKSPADARLHGWHQRRCFPLRRRRKDVGQKDGGPAGRQGQLLCGRLKRQATLLYAATQCSVRNGRLAGGMYRSEGQGRILGNG